VSHISVYRRWRPKTFEEIIGQERITRTLQNAIASGRTSHAYLFAGHRGTGKTTTARILAKALNCANGPTPTPDNTCPQCEAINKGVSMDVIEIDGASNTSVDDVRDLKEKIVLAPTEGRYKIYIIDEVHMLSTSAFNALLKTLEEPPAHAVFVLVTTEPHRIPATVLSRCQRFDFRRVSFREITERLRTIARQDGIQIDDAALAQIARTADGSVRDAESVLDQLSAYTTGPIDRTLVTNVLGLVDEDVAAAFTEAALRRDVAAALRLAQETADAGKDIRQVVRTLLEYFRDRPGRPDDGRRPAARRAGTQRCGQRRALEHPTAPGAGGGPDSAGAARDGPLPGRRGGPPGAPRSRRPCRLVGAGPTLPTGAGPTRPTDARPTDARPTDDGTAGDDASG
jgi:DNA polymerase-3 subunit gamma/tau